MWYDVQRWNVREQRWELESRLRAESATHAVTKARELGDVRKGILRAVVVEHVNHSKPAPMAKPYKPASNPFFPHPTPYKRPPSPAARRKYRRPR